MTEIRERLENYLQHAVTGLDPIARTIGEVLDKAEDDRAMLRAIERGDVKMPNNFSDRLVDLHHRAVQLLGQIDASEKWIDTMERMIEKCESLEARNEELIEQNKTLRDLRVNKASLQHSNSLSVVTCTTCGAEQSACKCRSSSMRGVPVAMGQPIQNKPRCAYCGRYDHNEQSCPALAQDQQRSGSMRRFK